VTSNQLEYSKGMGKTSEIEQFLTHKNKS